MQLKTAGPLFVHCTPITKLFFFQYLVYYYISRFCLLHKQLVLHKRLIFYYASGCVTQAVKFLLRNRLLLHKQLIFFTQAVEYYISRDYYISSCFYSFFMGTGDEAADLCKRFLFMTNGRLW